jgi:hypothetical protein
MPEISTNDQDILRTFPQQSRLGLLVLRPVIIASGTVSGSPAQGATTVTLTGFSQDEAPDKHYTVIAGSAAGTDDGGKVRLLSIASNILTLAPNNIEWATYTFISILRVIEPWSILPDILNDQIDGTPYTDENTNYHPLARVGPPAWGLINETLKFFNNSEPVAGGGATISAHSWTFPGGSPSSSSSGGSAANPIEVTWSSATGHTPQYMKYTTTDTSGKTHTRYNPVWILNNFEECYCDFEIEGLSGSESGGTWEGRLRVFGDASLTEFPHDALVMIVAEDWYGGLKTSIGGNWDHRENVIFFGWIVRNTVFKDDEEGSVSFEVIGPVGKMDQLLSWPANFEFADDFTGTFGCTTTNWQQFTGMTCDRLGFHLLTQRTTLHHICDINLTGNTKLLRYVDIPETSIHDQLDNYILSPIGARVFSDRQGQIWFSRNPNLRPSAERSTIPIILPLELDDIRADPGLEIGVEEHEEEVSQVDFIGFNYDGADITPLYSLAPDTQFSTGTIEKVDGVRADDQTEANELAGLYLANFNNIWREIQVPSWNFRVFDIAPEEYVTLTLAPGDTRRGISWTNQKLICRSVDLTYDREKEAVFANATFEKDSLGPSGVAGFYPTEIPDATPTFPDVPSDGLVVFSSFWFRRSFTDAWENRGCVPAVNHGASDPWWFSPFKSNSLDPNRAIFVACGDSGLIMVSDPDGGRNWNTKAITAPPNTWSDATAPTDVNIDFVWISGDIWRANRFYALARRQEGSNWRGWLYITDDNFDSGTWVTMGDTPTTLKPEWGAVNGSYLFVTTWESTKRYLRRFNPLTKTFVTKYDLGTPTFDDTEVTVFPVTVEDDDFTWYVAGHMVDPVVLSGANIQIIRTLDAAADWEIVEDTWDAGKCEALKVGKLNDGVRKHWAVRSEF